MMQGGPGSPTRLKMVLHWESDTLALVVGGGFPKKLRNGVKVELVLHLHALQRHGCLRRDFTFYLRRGGVLKNIPCSVKKARKGTRWDYWAWNSFNNETTTLQHLADQVKFSRFAASRMSAGRLARPSVVGFAAATSAMKVAFKT